MSYKLLSTITLMSLTIASSSSCDSLWYGFTKEDPSHCAAQGSEVRCDPPQICNANSGLCENPSDNFLPLIVDGLEPNQMPVLAGAQTTVRGSGFQLGTSVLIGNQQLTNVTTNYLDQYSGTVPKAQNRCGKFDVSVTRPDGQKVVIPGGFTYTLDPFNGVIPANQHIFPKTVYNMATGYFDNDQNPDIIFSMGSQVSLMLNPGFTSSTLPLPLLTPTKFVRPVHFTNKQSVGVHGFAAIDDTNKSVGVFSFDQATGGYPQHGLLSTGNAIRFLLAGDLDQNQSDGILAVTDHITNPTLDTIYISRYDPIAMIKGAYLQFTTLLSVTNKIDSIIFANISNDKYPDIVISSTGKLTIVSRTGTPGPDLIKYQSSVKSLASGDWNGDGKIDLAGIETSTNKVLLALNNNTSSWTVLTADAGITAASQPSLIVGDMNCDGKDDIVVMPSSGNESFIKIIALGPNGQIQVKNTAQKFLSGQAVVGDFNSDANPDIAIVNTMATGNSAFSYIPGAIP